MWQATIDSNVFDRGALRIGVIYSRDKDSFTESYIIHSQSELETNIRARLAQLEELDKASILLGSFEPPVLPIEVDTFKQTLDKVYELNRLVDIGVVSSDDPTYVQAIQDAKTAFTVTQTAENTEFSKT